MKDSSSYTGGTVIRTITAQGSVITGSSASVYRYRNFDVRIGQSQLNGAVIQGSSNPAEGKYTCVGLYDGNFAPAACP